MRRAGGLFVSLLIAVILGCAPGARGAQMAELAEGVWAFVGADGATNSGFVVTGDGVVVIDSQGPRPLALLLRKKIREVTAKPVIYVINTHYHGDHTFGNQFFPEAWAVISHEKTRKALLEKDKEHRERFKSFFGPESLEGFALTLPNITFTERMTLRAGGRTMELVYAGRRAHTGGDVFVFLPEEGVVFAGDLLYSGRLPLLNDGDTAGALAALRMLAATKARKFVPGHGGVTGPGGVAEYTRYLTDLRAEVKRLMDEGRGVEEIKEEIRLPRYSGYVNYRKWLPANAGQVYKELERARRP
ncbi:MAG: MBL fold metallo-hydrolase [Thermodesulfobacteriota bacterium]